MSSKIIDYYVKIGEGLEISLFILDMEKYLNEYNGDCSISHCHFLQ